MSDEASKPPVSAEVEVYRVPGEGSPLDEDVELRAAKALHARIQGARKRASLICLISGLVLGFILATIGQSFLTDQLGGRFGTLALVIVFFAPLLGALKIAEYIADVTVKRNVDGWINAIAKEHGIPPSALEDHARIAGV